MIRITRVHFALAFMWGLSLASMDGARADIDHMRVYTVGAVANLVCSPDAVCDVRLPPGEKMTNVQVAPRFQWNITPRKTRPGTNSVSVVFVNPRNFASKTEDYHATMTITTESDHFYYVRMKSSKGQSPQSVAWQFPYVAPPAPRPVAHVEPLPTPEPSATPNQFKNFDYSWTCNQPFSPASVYDDGARHVHVVFGNELSELPVPFFPNEQLMNFGIEAGGLILDSVPPVFYLRVGAERSDYQVEIRRGRNSVRKGCHNA